MPNDNVCIVFPGGVARKMPQRLNDASLSDRSPINQHCCLKCHAIQSVKTDTCDMGWRDLQETPVAHQRPSGALVAQRGTSDPVAHQRPSGVPPCSGAPTVLQRRTSGVWRTLQMAPPKAPPVALQLCLEHA